MCLCQNESLHMSSCDNEPFLSGLKQTCVRRYERRLSHSWTFLHVRSGLHLLQVDWMKV